MTSTPVTPVDLSTVHEIADELDRALRTGLPVAPPSGAGRAFDVDTAYEVQQVNVRRALSRGDVRTGHKIGLTSLAMQRQLGVDEPDFGVLLASMNVPPGATTTQSLLQPRIEAEIAFLLGSDLDGDDLSISDVLAATAAVMPALEIIDSRIAEWKITLPDTVADNASSGAYVVGAATPPPADLRQVDLHLYRDGEEVASGLGSAALGHPAECVRWLARTLRARGELLRAGEIVLSGALHASVPVGPGETFEARSSSLGSVSVRFPGPKAPGPNAPGPNA